MVEEMTHSEDELKHLVRSAQEGDVRAFETLVRAFLPRLRRYARAFVQSPDAADELAQDALVKVYKNLRAFRFQSAFGSWVYVVVRHAFLDATRGRRATESSLEEPLVAQHLTAPSLEPAADERLLGEEEKQRLWAALRQLPLEYKEAVVLFDIEGQSYEEVAALLKVPVGTVKSRLSRGRKLLLELLSRDEGTNLEGFSSHKKVTHG